MHVLQSGEWTKRMESVNQRDAGLSVSNDFIPRYEGMMERCSSHLFVLDPTVKPHGAKHIGYIGNRLMVEPSETVFDALANKRSMRLDSFGAGPAHLRGSLGSVSTPFDWEASEKKLQDLKSTLIYHKVYCALRLQRLEKTKRHVNVVGNQLINLDHRCSNLSCSKLHKRIKLVIQVESGTITLPSGKKQASHPRVLISQPYASMPNYLQDKYA